MTYRSYSVRFKLPLRCCLVARNQLQRWYPTSNSKEKIGANLFRVFKEIVFRQQRRGKCKIEGPPGHSFVVGEDKQGLGMGHAASTIQDTPWCQLTCRTQSSRWFYSYFHRQRKEALDILCNFLKQQLKKVKIKIKPKQVSRWILAHLLWSIV